MYSEGYATSYLNGHTIGNKGLAADGAAYMGVARLGWLLETSRSSLDGKFTEADIVLCLNCFQGDLLSPDHIGALASTLCHDLGIELDDYGTTQVAPLIDNLRALSRVQKVAFADALEQMWHRGFPAGKDISEFYADLGIVLIPVN